MTRSFTEEEKARLRARIERLSIPVPECGCWLWLGAVKASDKHSSGGYGRIGVGKSAAAAHRVSFLVFNGPIPDGYVVGHRCDERSCVAPHHLYAATQQINLDDATRRDRLAKKLSLDLAAQIRALYASGAGWTHRKLAAAFGVSHVQIYHIVHGHYWSPAA